VHRSQIKVYTRAEVHASRVTIRGTVKPTDAIVQAFEEMQDSDLPALGRHHNARVAAGDFSVSVPLREGGNQLDVIASLADHSRSQLATVSVYRTRSPHCTRTPSLKERDLVGLTLAEGTRVAKARGCVLRVVERDGRKFSPDADLRFNRANIAVADGRIIRIVDGG
jgi:hypothetical protein